MNEKILESFFKSFLLFLFLAACSLSTIDLFWFFLVLFPRSSRFHFGGRKSYSVNSTEELVNLTMFGSNYN